MTKRTDWTIKQARLLDKAQSSKQVTRQDAASPYFEHGFWWWFDPKRNGWFVGAAPQIQTPCWST
jgi:hypothetical protein